MLKPISLCFALLLFAGCMRAKSPMEPSTAKDSISVPKTGNPYQPIDQSPMDMVYFPVDYPILKLSNRTGTQPVARVIFSRPHKRNREIFGSDSMAVVRYGKAWRMGANEATEIELFRPAMLDGKNIPAGKYTLYCIPFPDHWTIALNKNVFTWGLQIQPERDLLRTDLPVQLQNPALEDFTMKFLDAPDGAGLLIAWDNKKVVLPIQFSK